VQDNNKVRSGSYGSSGKGSPAQNDIKVNRKNRQVEIKEVLIQAVRLKMKLKKQLKALKGKKVIDDSIITSNLRLTNLENNDLYN